MTTNLDRARAHLEQLIQAVTHEPPARDHQDDYRMSVARAVYYARVDGEVSPTIRVYSIVVDAIDKTAALLDSINDINTDLAFLRAMWIDRQVLIEGEVLAVTAGVDDLAELCARVANATDRFGPELIEEHGGEPFFESEKQPGYRATEPDLPGFLED